MKIEELSEGPIGGLVGAARAQSKDPKVAARGRAQLAKAGARKAGSAKGQAAKKKKMAAAMLDQWQSAANQIRIDKNTEPTAKDLNGWVEKFMGPDKDLGKPYSGGMRDRQVRNYFSKLVDTFYVQDPAARAAADKKAADQKAQGAKQAGLDQKTRDAQIQALRAREKASNQPAAESKESANAMRKKYLTFLREAEARIQHAEDIIFWEGSKGAMRVLKSLRGMAEKGHQDVTLKWDGSPAIIFGRDESGQFIFTDKGGFFKKGGVGRTKSPALLKQELLGRSGGIHKDDPVRIEFANKMATLFKMYEKAVPQDHRGFFKGDLLYFTTPAIENNHYTFKPNIVTYSVGTETELGKRIGQSKSGVVIHREMDTEGNEEPFNSIDIFEGNDVLIVPSVTTVAPVEADTKLLDKAEQVIKKNAAGLDAMLHEPSLREKQLVDLPKIFYTYINSKVDTGLENLGGDFSQWLETSKLSQKKKAGVIEYINTHKAQFKAMWTVVTTIKKAKNGIIDQFDAQGGDVKQSIGDTPGGEGYVSAHPEGDIKLVPRASFSAANRASRN